MCHRCYAPTLAALGSPRTTLGDAVTVKDEVCSNRYGVAVQTGRRMTPQ